MGTPIEDNQANDLQLLLGEDDETPPNENEDSDSSVEEPDDDISEDENESDSDEETEDTDEDSEDSSKEEDESEDDEDLDSKAGADFSNRPTYRQLKEYDPKLLKKFPGLRDMFFREREFTKLYPTVEDAQEAYNELTQLKAGEQRISTADPEDFLEILKDYSPDKERKFIREFLPALSRRNKQAFLAITEPVLKTALKSMFTDAKRNGNANLEASALNAHEWLFGNDKIDEPARIEQPRPNQSDPEKEELKRKNQQILTERHNEFTSGILSTASSKIRSRIQKEIPEDVSDFTKNAITKEVMDKLAGSLRDDPAHRSNMDRLLRQANKDNYSVESKDRVLHAYLSRAITGIPSILKKVKAEALKGAKPQVSTPKRANGSDSRSPKRDATKIDNDKAKAVRSGKISALDFLNS
jgi:hypothetical protein